MELEGSSWTLEGNHSVGTDPFLTFGGGTGAGSGWSLGPFELRRSSRDVALERLVAVGGLTPSKGRRERRPEEVRGDLVRDERGGGRSPESQASSWSSSENRVSPRGDGSSSMKTT